MRPRTTTSALAAASAAVALFSLALPRAETQAPSPRSDEASLTVAFSGDLLLHTKVVSAGRSHGWDRVFSGLRASQRAEGITIANLETPLSEANPPHTGSPPILGAPPTVAAALAEAGLDAAACANNHAWDQRSAGLVETIHALERAALAPIGCGRVAEDAYRPHLLHADGRPFRGEGRAPFALIGATQHVNGGPGRGGPESVIARIHDEALGAAIDEARARDHVVAVAVHWSRDFVERPLLAHRRLAHAWIERGVDLVLGSGPHVLQEVERVPSPRGEALIAYSLGNLVSNQGQRYEIGRHFSPEAHPAVWLPTARDGALLRVQIRYGDGRVHLERVSARPLWTATNYWEVMNHRPRREAPPWDIRVIPLDELEDSALREERLEAIRRALGPSVELEWPTS